MSKDSISSLFDSFAALLEYPSAQTKEKAQVFLDQVQVPSEAVEELEKFIRAIGQLSLDRMQEVYTITLDMQPVCYARPHGDCLAFHRIGLNQPTGRFLSGADPRWRNARIGENAESLR